jgi:hypothetical protein
MTVLTLTEGLGLFETGISVIEEINSNEQRAPNRRTVGMLACLLACLLREDSEVEVFVSPGFSAWFQVIFSHSVTATLIAGRWE